MVVIFWTVPAESPVSGTLRLQSMNRSEIGSLNRLILET